MYYYSSFSLFAMLLPFAPCWIHFFYSVIHQHPCMRSPCGPYSQCHAVEDHAICACLSGYFGTPPNCHPECVSNADCPLDKSCVNQICSDPCPGVCGYNARCHIVNHNPICSCNAGYSGDPFVRCVEELSKHLRIGRVCRVFRGKLDQLDV